MFPTVIITGASTGIGRTLSLIMAREGYHLGLTARRPKLLEELKTEIVNKYPQAKIFYIPCDVTNEQECRGAIQKLSSQLGRLDVFVANAGIGFPTPAWRKNWEDIKQILMTNTIGCIASLETAKEIMLDQKSGHLVGISSVAAYRGLPETSAYCTSKAALTTYLESIRVDLKPYNINVTSIHPGYIDTPMTKKNKYYMPLLLSSEVGTEKIFRAIKKKKKRYILPWPLKFAVWIMEFMPNALFDKLISLRSRKVFE